MLGIGVSAVTENRDQVSSTHMRAGAARELLRRPILPAKTVAF